MEMNYGIALREKPGEDGLNRNDICDLYDMLGGKEVYPVEYNAVCQESSAMGFITAEAANKLEFDYGNRTKLGCFIARILDDMSNEREDCTYEFQGIKIWLSR